MIQLIKYEVTLKHTGWKAHITAKSKGQAKDKALNRLRTSAMAHGGNTVRRSDLKAVPLESMLVSQEFLASYRRPSQHDA